MNAAAQALPRDESDADPRNAVLALFTATLEQAIEFAKSHDCEPQLRTIVKRLIPDLVPPADLFGHPIGKTALPELIARAVAAEAGLSDLFLTMVQRAPGRLAQRRLTASEHEAHKNLADLAGVLLELRKQPRT